MARYVRVDRLWTGEAWVDDGLLVLDDDGVRPATDQEAAQPPTGRIAGTVLPPLTDCHVHLGLSDFAVNGAGALGRVLDLGWEPRGLSALVERGRVAWPQAEVRFAGTFLTAVGGYPSTRPWAPAGSATELADTVQAAEAVDRLRADGATVVKITLNTVAGPVFTDELLSSIVDIVHRHGLPVVAHVEGEGQAVRAWRAGVDAFAHTPWEPLSTVEIEGMAADMVWISTVDMHGRGSGGADYTVAMDNLTLFVAHGGRVAYGTDLGNGFERADLNLRELRALGEAGLSGDQLLGALTGAGLLPRWGATVSLIADSGFRPYELEPTGMADALATSRPLHAAQFADLLS